MNERPSIFLVEKCQSLFKAIHFFMDPTGRTPVNEKRLTFLGQIEFWSWEMDEMIYAVQNFGERAQAWIARKQGLDQLIRAQGILIRPLKISAAVFNRAWYSNHVVAPINEANKVIEKWNELLRICESSLLVDPKDFASYNVQAERNLDKFRKTPLNPDEYPKLVEDEDERKYV